MRKTIKVLHIITKFAVGGAQENTIFTCSMLNKNLFDSSILCGTEKDEEGNLINAAEYKKIPLFFIPELVRRTNPVKDIIALIKIKKLIQMGKFDIVHTHSSKAGILGRIAARIAKTPVIIHTAHGWNFHDFMNAPQKKFIVLCERIAGKFTDKIILVTKEDIKKGLKEGIENRDKYIVIRSGIDLEQFNPRNRNVELKRELGIKKEEKVIGTVARLSPQKNIKDFVKIAHKVSGTLKNTKFLVVGDGKERKLIEATIKEMHLEEKVYITGLRNDIPEIFSIFDVFVLTSLWEGLPRAVVEALACGVPVVANAVDGVKEIIRDGDNGYLVRPKDVDSAAKKVIQILSYRDTAERIRSKTRKGLEEFSIKKMIFSIAKLYTELVWTKSFTGKRI